MKPAAQSEPEVRAYVASAWTSRPQDETKRGKGVCRDGCWAAQESPPWRRQTWVLGRKRAEAAERRKLRSHTEVLQERGPALPREWTGSRCRTCEDLFSQVVG